MQLILQQTLEIREIPEELWKKPCICYRIYNIAGIAAIMTVGRSSTLSNTETFVKGITSRNRAWCNSPSFSQIMY